MAVKIDGKTMYENRVLYTFERNFHDDSDFYAIVWDEDNNRLHSVEYATTRAYTYGNVAHVDATDEVKEKASAYLFNVLVNSFTEASKHAARIVEIGKQVRINRGRKNKGAEGRVFYMAERRYGTSTAYRIGVTLDGEKDERGRYINVVWDYARNADVVNPEQYEYPPETIKERAKEQSQDWHFFPFVEKASLR